MRALVVALVCLSSAVAHAQDTRAQRARELFEEGMAALGGEHATDAIGPFRRSLALSPRVPTAYNLALALRATSQFVEADRLLAQIEEGAFGELDALTREHVSAHRAELAPRIATLVVNATADVEVEIDDRGVGRASPEAPIEHALDPGPHVVRGVRADGTTVERRVTLAEGERAVLVLPVPALVSEPVAEPRPGGDRDEEVHAGGVDVGLVVLFTAIGVLVAGGAVAIGVVVATAPGSETDPVWGNTLALSF